MKNDILVVGVGPGNKELLTFEAKRAIENAVCVVVAKRHAHLAAGHSNIIPLVEFTKTLDAIEPELKKHPVTVLVSGDPGVYSLLNLLTKRFSGDRIKVLPGVSSLQAVSAAAAESWNDAEIISGHGREVKVSRLLYDIDRNVKTIFFCGPKKDASWLASLLSENGFDRVQMTVGERLSYEDERVITGSPSELKGKKFDPMSIVYIKNESPTPLRCSAPQDSEFIRTEVPMTKGEIRSVILDKLKLEGDSVFWDIGAGTGSISVAVACVSPDIDVHSFECEPKALETERKNRDKFRLFNIQIHEGYCPESIEGVPAPTHVFVGGSGGRMSSILSALSDLGREMRIVISSVTFESMSEIAAAMKSEFFSDVEIVQISVSKGKRIETSTIMSAQNPITIFSAVLNGECKPR